MCLEINTSTLIIHYSAFDSEIKLWQQVMTRIDSILNKIGISQNKKLLFDFQNKTWKQKIAFRLHKGLIEIKPDSFLVHEDKLIALFFDFTKDNNIILASLFKKIWNLGGVPVIFIITNTTVEIYNGFSFDTEKSSFDKLKIGKTELNQENIVNNFSIWDIFSGKSFENIKQFKSQVDEKLLENLENTKNILTKHNLNDIYAQNIIGRLLFSRYLLDRGVNIESKYFTDKNSFLQLIKNKKLLYEYFDYLKITFNGDLFPVTDEEIHQITDIHLNYLYELFSGSDIREYGIRRSLFEMYDFNIIPIELISEVYERFMGKEKKKLNAAYYTPSFLVDFILEKTVKQYIKKNRNCKIFDPSCGSGIFLVESLRNIIEINLDENGVIKREKLEKIITENIYGIDIDENAINLSIFSLCLTLLDYIEPKDITKFKFPKLKNNNLFIADFFDLNHQFNEKIKNLDFIIGNPPWGSDKDNDNLHIKYFKSHKIPISDKQIAQSFLARTKDFSSKTTKCSLVLPSKPFLYNHNAKEFRAYLLKNFIIKELLELSPVRHQLFSEAVAPTSIIFYNYADNNDTKENVIIHTSIKPNIFLKYLKLIVIEKSDVKEIKQHYFQTYDWLWKIMLYGNVLDFYLIKRLKNEYDSLNEVIEKNNLSFGQGFIKGGDKVKKFDASFILDKPYLDTKKKALSKFFINEFSLEKWKIKTLHRPRTKEVFQPPYILLKKGFSKQDFSLVSVYSEKEFVFTNSITAINGNNKELLKNICGILNSILSSYYLLLQGTSAGVEREQGDDKVDRFNIPIVINDKIFKIVKTIQKYYNQYHKDILDNLKLKKQIIVEQNNLNEIILDSFELSDIEKSLIDYAVKITIPQINNSNKPISKTTNEQLKQYAIIFFDHFKTRWNGNPDYFEIDIYYNNYVVGVNFKVVNSKPKQNINFYPDKNIDELFQFMKIGEEKITDTFYKQRDIRGFNESSFYVIKPNQYKNWHPAVAHGDLAEFTEAMLNAEKDMSINGE